MSEIDRWLSANNRYLDGELKALRARLAARADQPLPVPVAATVRPFSATLQRWFRPHATTPAAEPVAPPVDSVAGPVTGEDAPEASAKYVPALVVLSQRLGLSEFERQVLLMCAAMEFDTGFGALCSRTLSGAQQDGPTFALALATLDDPAWDVMSPERPLRYWRLIDIHQPGATALVTSPLRADERIVNYIKGLNYLDDRLSPLVAIVGADDGAGALPPSHAATADAIVAQLADGARPSLFRLSGRCAAGKLEIARSVATQMGMTLYRLRADGIPAALAENQTFVRLWQREAALLPIALYVDAEDAEAAHLPAVARLLDSLAGLVFVAAAGATPPLTRPAVSHAVDKPLPAEQQQLWLAALGTGGATQAALLTGQFDLDGARIRAIAAEAGEDEAALWSAALHETRPALDTLAQAIVPKARWDDIELPVRERAQLAEIAAQVRHRSAVYDDWGFRARLNRGLGISVLFAGDSGTGKTMAAEALAGELNLLLYRIDLSGVVSKFIGETEKNLRTLFDAAEDGGAVLFFDEADALFGKRSEVNDSHDRYANIEVNYLLQRMESYRGLAILTTNMKASLDQAFVRRLRFIVNFPFPGAPERTEIWRKVFPAAVDTSALDFARLARLNVTGGNIHNIALNAAFAAAAAGGALTMPVVLEAARREFLKVDKPINESDFRWLEPVEDTA